MQHELTQEILRGNSPHEARKLAANLHQAIQASRQSILEELAFENARLKKALHCEMLARLDRIEQYALLSAQRVVVHGDAGAVLVRSKVGYILCQDSDYALLAALLENGELESGTRLLIERFLAPGDVFVDVGANIGLTSLAAARAMRGTGKIYAFEPYPASRALMERSLWINGVRDIAQIHETVVSDRDGRLPLFLGATSGHHSIYGLDEAGQRPSRQIEVDSVTLDSVLPQHQTITLIKIDVEGAELEVIKGAMSTLDRNKHVALIAEFGPSHLRRSGHQANEWFGVFESLGYCFRRINSDTGDLENVAREELLTGESTNLFFARPTSSAWIKLGIVL